MARANPQRRKRMIQDRMLIELAPWSEVLGAHRWARLLLHQARRQQADADRDHGSGGLMTWQSDPATAKQLEFLAKLGATEMPKSKGDASRLIDNVLGKKHREPHPQIAQTLERQRDRMRQRSERNGNSRVKTTSPRSSEFIGARMKPSHPPPSAAALALSPNVLTVEIVTLSAHFGKLVEDHCELLVNRLEGVA
jgi:hypothetical protein